jgi:hypothetical protein
VRGAGNDQRAGPRRGAADVVDDAVDVRRVEVADDGADRDAQFAGPVDGVEFGHQTLGRDTVPDGGVGVQLAAQTPDIIVNLIGTALWAVDLHAQEAFDCPTQVERRPRWPAVRSGPGRTGRGRSSR